MNDSTGTPGVGWGGWGLIFQGQEGAFTSRGEALPNESIAFDLIFVLSCLKASVSTQTEGPVQTHADTGTRRRTRTGPRVYTRARTDTHTDMHADPHGHTRTRICTQTHMDTHGYTHGYAHRLTRGHTHTRICTQTHMRGRTRCCGLRQEDTTGHSPGPLALRSGSHTLRHPGGESANSSYPARKVIVRITRASVVKTPLPAGPPTQRHSARGAGWVSPGHLCRPAGPRARLPALLSPSGNSQSLLNKAPHVSPQGVTGPWGLQIKQLELGVSPRGLRPAGTKGGFTRTRLVLGFSGSHEARQEGCGMPVSNMVWGGAPPQGPGSCRLVYSEHHGALGSGAKEQRGRGRGGPGVPEIQACHCHCLTQVTTPCWASVVPISSAGTDHRLV